jgi:hypothetical protein
MKIALVEGVDYTLENNKMVLTKEFLLKRGYCCNSKCRNCPYKKQTEQITQEFIVKCSEEK